MQDPDSQIPGRHPPSAWAKADAACAALETALRTAAVEDAQGFAVASSHLHKVTDMRARFAERRPVVERKAKEG